MITAEMVNQLRKKTDLPMMDCKKALTETNGDMDQAVELLRKRGASIVDSFAGRETREGFIGKYTSEKCGCLAAVLCETGPVAKHPDFAPIADRIAKKYADGVSADAERNEISDKFRENVMVGDVHLLMGKTAAYVHHDGRVGVIIAYEGNDDAEVLKGVCMHIAFAKPTVLSRDLADSKDVAYQQTTLSEEALKAGKPQAIVDKMITGKMNRWYSEFVLLEQPSVQDDKKTVGKIVADAGVVMKGYYRMTIGNRS